MARHADHHHVLDRVMVHGVLELEGQIGVITQVRRYVGGEFRYGVALNDGLIMDGSNLLSTGEREPVETYFPPGRLFPWDEVELRRDGRVVRGVVDAWYDDDGVDESEMCEEKEVVRIGRSGRRRAGRARSTKVSETGEVRAVEHYEIFQDLMDVIADANPLG
jgi:hypothetical protein